MFTVDQIHNAHSKVKSGADFPAYIRDLKTLGVTSYTSYVNDGHTEFKGNNTHNVSTPARYEMMEVAAVPDKEKFINDLSAHQQGKTDYPQFCADCAANGVEYWKVDLAAMTCTYFDKNGTELLMEPIPDQE